MKNRKSKEKSKKTEKQRIKKKSIKMFNIAFIFYLPQMKNILQSLLVERRRERRIEKESVMIDITNLSNFEKQQLHFFLELDKFIVPHSLDKFTQGIARKENFEKT